MHPSPDMYILYVAYAAPASAPLHISTFPICVFIKQINFLPQKGLLITRSDYLPPATWRQRHLSAAFCRLEQHPRINTLTILTASSSPLRLGLPSASPKESSVGGSVASVGGSLTWEAEDLEGEPFLGAGVGAAGH